MVGLVVRKMAFKQLQVIIDQVGEPEPGYQLMDRSDPSIAHRLNVRTDFIVDFARTEHGLGLRRPRSGPAVALRHFCFAFFDVPAALLFASFLHRKDLFSSDYCVCRYSHYSQ